MSSGISFFAFVMGPIFDVTGRIHLTPMRADIQDHEGQEELLDTKFAVREMRELGYLKIKVSYLPTAAQTRILFFLCFLYIPIDRLEIRVVHRWTHTLQQECTGSPRWRSDPWPYPTILQEHCTDPIFGLPIHRTDLPQKKISTKVRRETNSHFHWHSSKRKRRVPWGSVRIQSSWE